HQCFLSHYLCCASLNSQSFPTRRSSDLTEKEKDLIRKGDLEERKSRLYFTIGHVFDVSQTRATANDLPEIFPSRWLEGDVKNYEDRKSTRLNSSHVSISYAVFCLKKKTK